MGATNGTTAMMVRTDGPALVKADASRAFEPGSIGEAMKLAQVLVASRLLPRSVATPEAAFAIIATGRELGLTAMQSLRSIHVIEGKPTLSADLVAALVKSRADVCEWFRLVRSDAQVATYQTKRRGEPEPTTMSFSWEDAQRAGVTGKDNWRKYPAAMLRARCITALARAVYPDLAMGIYDPDEIGDVTPAPGNYEVVATDLPQSPKEDTEAFGNALDKLAECATVGQVNAVAKQIAAAHKAGRLTDAQLEGLKVAVASKRASLAKPAPEPPPSEPRAEDDGPSHDREPGEEG
jgi:hypothetical protein